MPFVCDYKCGNGVLDKYFATLGDGTTSTTNTGEFCEYAVAGSGWFFAGQRSFDAANNDATNKGYFKFDGAAGWDTTFDNNAMTNTDLTLGCNDRCKVVTGWTCPEDTVGLCSFRSGDGSMDGPFAAAGRTADRETWREWTDPADNTVKDMPYYSTTAPYDATYDDTVDYSSRMQTEQCDNGGDTTHGCDAMGQIMTGW